MGYKNYGNVTGKTGLGGIAFSNEGTIQNCTNSGTLIATSTSGTVAEDGIVHTNTGTVTDCTNNA